MKWIRAQSEEFGFEHSPQVRKALRGAPDHLLRHYEKDPPLVKALAQKHKVPANRVFLESGVTGIIHRVFDSILEEGVRVLFPELGYPYYHKLAGHHSSTIETYGFVRRGNTFSYDVAELLEKLEMQPSIVVIVDPESPLGCSVSKQDLHEILKRADGETLVILDQVHEGFREKHKKSVSALVRKYPNLLIARGFSKYYGLAGLRVGYGVCGKNVKEMIRFHDKYLGFNNISQHIAYAALKSEPHYRRMMKKILDQKSRLKTTVQDIEGISYIDGDTISSVLEIRNRKHELQRRFEDAKIHVRWLETYHTHLKPNPLENLVRITTVPAEQMDRIIEVLKGFGRSE